MGSIKNWLVQKLLLGYVKDFLSKLPFDGWKSAIGILLIVLGELLKALPQYSGPLSILFELLRQLPSDPITDMGIVTLITGAVHKLLKYFGKE